MKSSLQVLGLALLCFTASAWSADPVVTHQHDVVFTGPLGIGRTVRSETLILPNANSVLRTQATRDRRAALQEENKKQQSDARRQAEADSMTGAEPVPVDAVSVEAVILEASEAGTSQSAVEGTAEVDVADAPVPVSNASPTEDAEGEAAGDAASGEAAGTDAPAPPADEQPAETPAGE